MDRSGLSRIEAAEDAQSRWMQDIQAVAEHGLVIRAKTSGYVYENAAGERIFMCYPSGFPSYRNAIEAVAKDGYSGFSFA